jgi:NADPH2:quinone reductase
VSGVNPTDWKARAWREPAFPEIVPNQDGAGIVDAVGPDVPDLAVGQPVWLWEAAWQRPGGTAQEYVVLPERQAVPLPNHASFELGASLGIPALTAHCCLTTGPVSRLTAGSLSGRTVLVAGGAGAVGNAAIQLARWAGASVVSTVSSVEKAELATRAGAHAVVNYREADPAAMIRRAAPDGVDIVVEVSPSNIALDHEVIAPHAVIAFYASDPAALLPMPELALNARHEFVLVYTVSPEQKANAVADVATAVADRALQVGAEAGLPLHRFPLERTADAHSAVEGGAIGKVLIEVE